MIICYTILFDRSKNVHDNYYYGPYYNRHSYHLFDIIVHKVASVKMFQTNNQKHSKTNEAAVRE